MAPSPQNAQVSCIISFDSQTNPMQYTISLSSFEKSENWEPGNELSKATQLVSDQIQNSNSNLSDIKLLLLNHSANIAFLSNSGKLLLQGFSLLCCLSRSWRTSVYTIHVTLLSCTRRFMVMSLLNYFFLKLNTNGLAFRLYLCCLSHSFVSDSLGPHGL